MIDEIHFSLKWDDFNNNVISGIGKFHQDEDFVDVTIACGGMQYKAHKIILSACSPYFKDILKNNPCQHPIVIVNGIPSEDMEVLLSYVYQGQVNVPSDRLKPILNAAKALKILGLSKEDGQLDDEAAKDYMAHETTSAQNNQTSKNVSDTHQPLAKKPKLTKAAQVPKTNKGIKIGNSSTSGQTSNSQLGISDLEQASKPDSQVQMHPLKLEPAESPSGKHMSGSKSKSSSFPLNDYSRENSIPVETILHCPNIQSDSLESSDFPCDEPGPSQSYSMARHFIDKEMYPEENNQLFPSMLFNEGSSLEDEDIELAPGSGVHMKRSLLAAALRHENPNIAARELFRVLFTEEELATSTLRGFPNQRDTHRSVLDQIKVNAVIDLVLRMYGEENRVKLVHSLQMLLVRTKKLWKQAQLQVYPDVKVEYPDTKVEPVDSESITE